MPVSSSYCLQLRHTLTPKVNTNEGMPLRQACIFAGMSVKGWFDGATKNIQAANLARIARHWSLAA